MKIITSSDTDRLTVTGMVVFDPWPFAEHALAVNTDVGFIKEDGCLSDVQGGVNLTRLIDSAFATLSDGTVAVCDPEYVTVGQEVRR